jgi:hypothetical protein
MKTRILFSVISIIMAIMVSEAQTQEENMEQKAAKDFTRTLELIESGQFRFVAARALPSNGGTIPLIGRQNQVDIMDENANLFRNRKECWL